MPWWSWARASDAQPGDEVIARTGERKGEQLRKGSDPDEIVWGQHKSVFRDSGGRKVYVDPDADVGRKH